MHGNILDICFCTAKRNMHDIPASDSFLCPLRKGFLQKLTGRGWLYSGSWKSRFCVLDGSKFYFYEKEQSKGSEKNCGVINLDYYDLCEENSSRDKKNPHVFVIGTSVKGFFDNRHQFATETSDEMHAWIQSIQNAIAEARINRTKPTRKKSGGKSPDLSDSSQEHEKTNCGILVNATKDRAKGPQGRRLPNRKSMMPQSRSAEVNDIRQRSISLSSPHTNEIVEEEEEPSSPRLHIPGESKWLSMSMEEMERGSDDAFETQRSSSAFDIQRRASPPKSENEVLSAKPVHKRLGNLMGHHAAITKELEMRLKNGRTPGPRRQPSESEEESPSKKEERSEKNIEQLTTKVNSTQDSLRALEEKVNMLTKKVDTDNESHEKASQVGDLLHQVTVTLHEAERITEESKKALSEANKARIEYENLVTECKNLMARLSHSSENQDHMT